MIEPTSIVALTMSDGSIARMQFYADPTDEAIQEAVDKMVNKPVSWERKDAAWSEQFSVEKVATAESLPQPEDRLAKIEAALATKGVLTKGDIDKAAPVKAVAVKG